jgi:hypothetical protein
MKKKKRKKERKKERKRPSKLELKYNTKLKVSTAFIPRVSQKLESNQPKPLKKVLLKTSKTIQFLHK